jgi:hypothetical protein
MLDYLEFYSMTTTESLSFKLVLVGMTDTTSSPFYETVLTRNFLLLFLDLVLDLAFTLDLALALLALIIIKPTKTRQINN